jgi:hypothetical protein
MSKGYHEEEIELVKRQFLLFENNGASSKESTSKDVK